MIKRKAVSRLEEWYAGSRRKPLVLRGARQVGKSTLVREFCANRGLVLNEINLERHPYLDAVFRTLDTKQVINELEALLGNCILQPGALLFLDEIQAVPQALPLLRYFYEEYPDLPVIAAGSLLEFALADHAFSMPVGRIEYLHLGPCTIREYLQVVEPGLARWLDEYVPGGDLPEAAHRKLLVRLREFLFLGGFPEAIWRYQERQSLSAATAVHRSLVETYQDDFAKYAHAGKLQLLRRVFRALPVLVGKKVKYSRIAPEERAGEVRAALDMLRMARLCHAVHHTHANGIPLDAEADPDVYKLLLVDIGLMNGMTGADWLLIGNMDPVSLVNEGALAEQFIGQHLAGLDNSEPRLHYWLREGRAANAEVDFLYSRGDRIIPVEVKAGKSGSLKSLQQFVLQKGARLAVRFDLNPPSLQRMEHAARTDSGVKTASCTVLSLPLYMVEELPRLIDALRAQGS